MTLDAVAGKTREILKWSAIFLGALFVIFIALRIFSIIQTAFAPPPPPGVAFGKLPSPDFPNNTVGISLSYTLDTISGQLPVFSLQEKVFKMTESQPDLLALSKAQNMVEGVGFEEPPVKISENIYQWTDQEKSRTLTMNIQDINFNMISDFLSNPDQPFFDQEIQKAVDTARGFLESIKLLPEDLDLTKTQTGLFSVKNYSIIPATSLSSTQVLQVNFFQKPFNNLPIYYPRFSISPLNFLVGQVDGQSQVVEANFFYQKPSSESSTYPIKTASQAFEDLKKGKGYITTLINSQSNKISINNVSLGYYVSEKKQDFLLPIVVFQGNNFTAYVAAVTDEWIDR